MTMTGVEPDHQQHVSASVMGDDNAFLTRHSRCSSSSMEEEEEGGQQQSQQQEAGAEQLTYSRMAHLLAVYQNKVRDSKRIISRLKRQKDAQLQAVISQLLLLEAHLRREQKGIVGQLAQRDHVISAQRQEIDRLRRDNRRLINKLKKFNEVCTDAGGDVERLEPRVKISRVEPSEERTLSSRKGHSQSLAGSPSSRKSSSGMIRVATSVSELINCSNGTSFFKPQQALHHTNIRSTNRQPTETVNPNVASVRATTDRVFHKPPIAEKPRVASRVPRGQQNNQKSQHLVRSYGGKQCTIVSTISRLLEEESDTTTTGGSCSSEPSSPEATLKPTTPRVIRLARKFEEGLNSQNLAPYANNSSSESSPELVRQDDRSSKSYIMDEYEVTSGYNSESVSEHEYENVRVLTQGSDVSPSTKPVKQEEGEEEGEEEDNYVILRAVKENADAGNWVDIPEDQHIYSNVEFASGLLVKDLEDEEDPIINHEDDDKLEQNSTSSGHGEEGKVLETNLDSLDSSVDDDNLLSESLRAAMNVPRSRHNINFIIESDGDHMTENFEEFTLDSLELEGDHEDEDRGRGKENLPISEQRRCGDGAETKLESKNKEESKLDLSVNSGSASIVMMGSGQYEKFLEATGLSQKSILTPTRMFSNHRSVLKPRDVKHRNKLRAAFTTLSTLEETPSSGGGYRYWTEPYL
ncbi:uncharacterized protein [Procambarus clarkii]|uniref:uncharacterized protein n=1 Tax=Procambarus clarkii TaxID=6728 RepID=UPI001E672B81|nr:uncharacterized protein LOC123769005 [Procambarus clarkii]